MKRISLLALLAPIALGACSNLPAVTSWLTPYRIDIRQGNLVTPDMVAQLKLGQSREQVRFILGTPLLTDPFHGDRWDYVYSFQPGRGTLEKHRVTVYFTDGKLSRIDGDVAASAAAGNAAAQAAPRIIEIGPAAAASTPGTPAATKPEDAKAAPQAN